MCCQRGNVIIKAILNDSNYAPATAEFELVVSKKEVTLTPDRLVLTYNGDEQKVKFISNTASFVPITEGDDKNVEVTYTLNTDSSVTIPKNAGTYTVTYRILGNAYTGGGTAQLTINKYKAEIRANDCEKVYGEENPTFTVSALVGEDAKNSEYIEKLITHSQFHRMPTNTEWRAAAGDYQIKAAVKDGMSLDDENYDFSISKNPGKLTVKPKALAIKISGATRVYGGSDLKPNIHMTDS